MYKDCSHCQRQFLYTTYSPQVWAWNFHVLNLYSMNNLLSYCWLVDAKIRASDKDLPLDLKERKKYSYLKKTRTNEITGFLPLPSKNDNYKLMVNSVCNLCLFTVETEGKRLMSCQKWYFSNLSTDDMTNEDYLRWDIFKLWR